MSFSFREFAGHHEPGCEVDAQAVSTRGRLVLQQLLEDYLKYGGFPAVQDLYDQRAVLVLQSYMQRVVARDVIERHNLGNPQVVSLFAQSVVGANGRTLSLRKTVNDFKSRGVTASRAMLGNRFAPPPTRR